ncbi:MAG: acetyl-CoA carboxylase biotin carboxyl carrier protein [Gemmatimonadota bacterium]|nr:acetyl-CoA carboxylase biotin carboxyl carrier protein [Gemmatimonadota bacterium]
MDLDFVRGLIEAVDESGIDSLEIARGGTKIRIVKSPGQILATSVDPGVAAVRAASAPVAQAAPVVAAPAAAEPAAAPERQGPQLVDVASPMVGTFYRSPAPEAPSYVEVGSRVVKGQTLCVLEAMKLMNELEAEVQGIVREIRVENAEPVEFGQILFRIEPEA